MVDLRRDEYVALRATIRQRGTVRMLLPLVSMTGWALVTMLGPSTFYGLLPLSVLVAGFEAVRSLHVNVERIGRYIQVFFEEAADAGPRPEWETVSMRFGRTFPGAGSDPLFVALFIGATVINGALVALGGGLKALAGVAALLHVLFVARVLVERNRAGRQRAEDLERFRIIAREQHAAPASTSAQSSSIS